MMPHDRRYAFLCDPTVKCDACQLVYISPDGSKCAFKGCPGTLHTFILEKEVPREKPRCEHEWVNYLGMEAPIEWCKRCGALDIGATEPLLPEFQKEDT